MRAAAALWLAFACATAGADAPRRVASINLCTDALLFELAAPGQIASVTELSRDPALSMHAAAARRVPVNRGRAEEFIGLAPDLILAGAGSATPTQDLLRRLGFHVVAIAPPASLDEVIAGVREVGALLGQTARAERLAQSLAALARPPAYTPPVAPAALIVQPGGYVPGPDTLGPTLLALAGLADQAPRLGLGGGGFVPLEALVLARPAFMIRGDGTGGRALADDFGTHPALAAARADGGGLVPVTVNDAAWACGSGALVGAVHGLRAAVASP